jgi:hypothetical protein
MTPTPTEVVKAWVAALRSGEYVQGHGRLIISHPEHPEFCCLGVLCDLALRQRWADIGRVTLEDDPTFSTGFGDEFGFSVGAPPQTVRDLLLEPASVLDIEMFMADLMTFNDQRRFTFSQIADVIEDAWEHRNTHRRTPYERHRNLS